MSFASLGLSEPIVRAVTERGYTEPTPIQARAIPAVLSGGDLLKTYDLVILREWTGQAPMTSSGKTIGRDAVVIHVKDVYGGLPAFRHSAHACLMGWSSVH